MEENKELNGNEKDYLEVIEELKKNSVSKEAYEKLQQENAKLIKTVANNEKIEFEKSKPVETIEQKTKRHQALVERLTTASGRKGIDLVKDSIEFRKLTKELYGVDPMLIKVNSNNPAEDTEILKQKMDKVEQKFTECIDNCDGTEGDFLNEVRKSIDPKSYPKPKKE